MEVSSQPFAAEEGHAMDRWSELLASHVQFQYTCWDRIVLTGYLDRPRRTETCLNDTHHLGIGRSLGHLPELHARMLATNTRYFEAQVEL
jgi:hypothetical protein